ncbi:MAG TPA: hypothetical protein VEX38_05555, partial [Fimbriimonadaceae bacterium]|nr:hypothetical protein [Fimbriimonadaceae bacterium]
MKKVCFLLSLTAVLAGCAAKAPVTGNAPKKPAFIRVVNLSSVPLTGLTDRQPFSSTEPGAAIAMRRIPSGDRKLVVTPAGAQSMEESINLQEGEVYSVVVTGEKKS